MSDFVVIKNIKSGLGDIHPPTAPQDNIDYSLMVDVSLAEVREKKGTGEDNPDKTYIFEPTGPIHLVNLTKAREHNAPERKDINAAVREAAGLSD